MNELPSITEKTIEQAILALERGARDFLSAIGGDAVLQTGGMIGDQFKFWRFKNTLRLVDQAASLLRARGIDPARVLPATLVPLLAAGSLQEAPQLQERWAALLANAADPNLSHAVRAAFVTILNDMSVDDVRVMEWLYSKGIPQKNYLTVGDDDPWSIVYWSSSEAAAKELGIHTNALAVVVANLYRLNLCEPRGNAGRGYDPAPGSAGYNPMGRTYDSLLMTPLGVAFMKAVSNQPRE
jgi:Abortive infection alpha